MIKIPSLALIAVLGCWVGASSSFAQEQQTPRYSSASGAQAFIDNLMMGERIRRARENAELELETKRLQVEQQRLLVERQRQELQKLQSAPSNGDSMRLESHLDNSPTVLQLAVDVLEAGNSDFGQYGSQVADLATLFTFGGDPNDFTQVYRYLRGLLSIARDEKNQ